MAFGALAVIGAALTTTAFVKSAPFQATVEIEQSEVDQVLFISSSMFELIEFFHSVEFSPPSRCPSSGRTVPGESTGKGSGSSQFGG